MELRFLKLREVIEPTRGDGNPNDLSAGLDFYVPKIDEEFIKAFDDKNTDKESTRIISYDKLKKDFRIILDAQGRCLIPTGIKLNLHNINGVMYDVNNGVALVAFNRGSMGSKGLVHGACVVDEDYQGELFMSVINTTNNTMVIPSNSKLLQFLLLPILKPTMVEVGSHTELFPTESRRGTGALGSTNK